MRRISLKEAEKIKKKVEKEKKIYKNYLLEYKLMIGVK